MIRIHGTPPCYFSQCVPFPLCTALVSFFSSVLSVLPPPHSAWHVHAHSPYICAALRGDSTSQEHATACCMRPRLNATAHLVSTQHSRRPDCMPRLQVSSTTACYSACLTTPCYICAWFYTTSHLVYSTNVKNDFRQEIYCMCYCSLKCYYIKKI